MRLKLAILEAKTGQLHKTQSQAPSSAWNLLKGELRSSGASDGEYLTWRLARFIVPEYSRGQKSGDAFSANN